MRELAPSVLWRCSDNMPSILDNEHGERSLGAKAGPRSRARTGHWVRSGTFARRATFCLKGLILVGF